MPKKDKYCSVGETCQLIQLVLMSALPPESHSHTLHSYSWLPLLVLMLAGLTAHVCFTNAMRYGDATLVVPIDFLRIPFIASVGVLLYAEPFDMLVLLGAAISAAGILWSLADARRYSARRSQDGAHR